MAAHHLQLLERAVKRLPASADLGAPHQESSASPAWHVLNAHLDWALPTLLQMTANLHALSSPAVRCPRQNTALSPQISTGHLLASQPSFNASGVCEVAEDIKVPPTALSPKGQGKWMLSCGWASQGTALLGEAGAAMQMGARERANYLRHLVAGRQAGEADILEEDEATLAGSNVAALRSWIRTVSLAPSPLCPANAVPRRHSTAEQTQKRGKHPLISCSRRVSPVPAVEMVQLSFVESCLSA